MSDQAALGPNGQLLNASNIKWYNNPDDTQPIQVHSTMQEGIVSNLLYLVITDKESISFLCQCPCPAWATTSTQLAAAIAAEKLNEFGNTGKSSCHCPTQLSKSQASVKHKWATVEEVDTDVDNNFTTSSSNSDDTDDMEISNEEVWNIQGLNTLFLCR